LGTAAEVYTSLRKIYEQSAEVELDPTLLDRLGVASWQAMLPDFELGPPSKENINDWMRIIDSWINAATGSLSALKNQTLEQLLVTESSLERWYREGNQVEAAPPPSKAPEQYATLTPGNERKLQTRLGWWDRFQTADGLVPSLARLIVAVTIVSAVLGFSASVGTASLTIYNGLAREVQVTIDGDTQNIAAFSTADMNLEMDREHTVIASAYQGSQIEKFEARVGDQFAHYIYNVASASPLVEWTQTYGGATGRSERYLGTPRWITSEADIFFDEPPESVKSRTGNATRDVLSGIGHVDPETAAKFVNNEEEFEQMLRTHVRWDSEQTEYYSEWLRYAGSLADIDQILEARRQDSLE
jgi:hypothetical protein